MTSLENAATLIGHDRFSGRPNNETTRVNGGVVRSTLRRLGILFTLDKAIIGINGKNVAVKRLLFQVRPSHGHFDDLIRFTQAENVAADLPTRRSCRRLW